MSGRGGLYAWLALTALLWVGWVMEPLLGQRWDPLLFILMNLSLPITVWACRSRPVRGRPLLGFVLGLLNYLGITGSFALFVGLVVGRLPHWTLPVVAFLVASSASYSLGAALVAGSRDSWTSSGRAFSGFLMALIPWLILCLSFID